MLRSIILGSFALVAPVAADCSRAWLKNATAEYLAAQTAGKAALPFLETGFLNYTENEKHMDVRAGILATKLKIDHNISLHDTAQCATFTEIVVADAKTPYIIGTRMLFNASDGKATFIESLVTKPGDWLFNATGYLYYESKENWDPIPEAKRDTQATIKAAGDAYFNRFANANVSVPWGTPCGRLEGGASTTNRDPTGNTCNLGLPSTIKVTNRRYVVDEEMGAVVIYVGFPGLDRSAAAAGKAAPDSHLFRVEGGKLRYIHTISSCFTPGCGSNFTAPPGLRKLAVRNRLSRLPW